MKKRILSIICIMFLLFTISSPLTGSVFTYADSEGLDDQQKAALAMSSYFNYRKGWYVGSTAGAIGVMKSYVDDFFNDDANNTGINSYSEFATHITVSKDNDNHWGVTIDNTGLVFLDHLVKWLLGKDKFPDLSSGGSWGPNDKTSNNVYRGYIYSGSLCFYAELTSVNSPITGYLLKESDVQTGNKLDLFSPEEALENYLTYNQKTFSDFNGTSPNNQWSFQRITVHYYSGNDYSFSAGRYYVANKRYAPSLLNSSIGYSAYDRTGDNVTDPTYYCNCIYSSREVQIRGFPAFIILANTTTGINKMYYGWVAHDSTDGYFGLTTFGEMSVNDHPYTPANVNFNTNNFDKNDVGQADENGDPVSDAPSKTFTPEYTTDQGDTYNYYTNETVNNFYNEYTNDYTYNTNNEYNNTVINNYTNPDNPSDPDNPSGGTTPPWDGSNAGTLTPDGNGGYNFNLPDLTIPDLDINWSLSGLTEKFPFSIPWDLMAFFTVLNAEPETPSIQATIDLGIVDWDIDWDLHNFDTLAVILRNLEFIGFCLALILITRSIIKG